MYRTYFASGRGVEVLGSDRTFLDLTPGGLGGLTRRLPANPRYEWWRRHDEYEHA